MSSAPSPALSALSALQPAASPGAPETRRRLLGAALAVFGRYGYRRASMEAVAAEAGISRQGLYRHYAGKEALFAAAISHLHDRGDAAGAEAAAAARAAGGGIAACGACTVLVDGQAVRSCSIAAADLAGSSIVTIEGLKTGEALHKLQAAWIEAQAPQCGYCQSGQIIAAAALLAEIPRPSDADIDAAMTNICRCGSYEEIRAAIHIAAASA